MNISLLYNQENNKIISVPLGSFDLTSGLRPAQLCGFSWRQQ